MIKLFGCKCSVGNYVIHSPWHTTPENLCKQVSARKCILRHCSLGHSALYTSMLPWPRYSISAPPFLCHTQGKAQQATCQLPSQSAVFGHHRHRRSSNGTLQAYDQQALPQPGIGLGWGFKGGDLCLRLDRSRACE